MVLGRLFLVVAFLIVASASPALADEGYVPNVYQTFRQSDFGPDSTSVPASSDRMGEAAGKLLAMARPFAILGVIAGLVLLAVGVFTESHKPAASGGIMLGGSALLYASVWAFAGGVVLFLVARQLYLERKRRRDEELEESERKKKSKGQRSEGLLGGVSVRSAVRAGSSEQTSKKQKRKSDDADLDDDDAELTFKEPEVHIKLTRPL